MAKPILLFNVIHSETARDFTEKILAIPEDKPVDILINSPGGSLSAGWTMLAALQGRKVVNMKVVGDASSMAFFFLLFATKTVAFDTSNFLIHRAASSDESELSEDELKDIESRNKIIREKLEARIHEDKFKKVTGKTFDDIFSMNGRLDVSLTAKEAKEIGLIDEVIVLDIKKREKIEAEYYDKIAALAETNNNNTKPNKMSKLKDLIFGEKEAILLAKIDDNQFAYNKVEVGAKIKATGKEEKSISGTFEADEKEITVVDNEITAITDVDGKQKQIDTLTETVTALADSIEALINKKQVIKGTEKDESQKQIDALTEKVTSLTAILDKAKLTASNPKLPEAEFKEDNVIENLDAKTEKRKIQKNIDAIAKEKAEAFSKYQNNREV